MPHRLLPLRLTHIRGVGAGLSPGGLSVPRHDRPVSYYALFQGWLLLSQPPGCLCAATPLPTEPGLRDLSRRSGLFPSRPRILASAVSLPWSPLPPTLVRLAPREGGPGIRRLVRVGKLDAPAPIRPRYLPGGSLPPTSVKGPRGCTSMHFGENQLSPGSIGISPLPTGHPSSLQSGWVRASTCVFRALHPAHG